MGSLKYSYNTPFGNSSAHKMFQINFFPEIPKIRFINFKIVFLKMHFFYSQFQNTLTWPVLHFSVYFFFNVRGTIIFNILNYLLIHICRLKVFFHGAHHKYRFDKILKTEGIFFTIWQNYKNNLALFFFNLAKVLKNLKCSK